MIPFAPWIRAIQTSDRTCCGVGLRSGLSIPVVSMQHQTSFWPSDQRRRRSTPRGTYQSFPAISCFSWLAG